MSWDENTRDPAMHHRITHLHAPSHRALSDPSSSSSTSAAQAQARRRQAALDAQRERRTHAFELARRAYEANRGELGLAGQAIEELSLGAAAVNVTMRDIGPNAGQYADASEDEDEDGMDRAMSLEQVGNAATTQEDAVMWS